jgi:hypothetical protein
VLRKSRWRLACCDVAVDGDALTGLYIAARNVPMPIARFRDPSAAFADGFNRLRAAVDETKASQANLHIGSRNPVGRHAPHGNGWL